MVADYDAKKITYTLICSKAEEKSLSRSGNSFRLKPFQSAAILEKPIDINKLFCLKLFAI